MEDQIPPSNPPQPSVQAPPQKANSPFASLTPEVLEAMKAKAREDAIRMALSSSPEKEDYPIAQPTAPANFQIPVPQAQPQVVYVRRNMTVAELIVVFAVACGIVFGVQTAWNTASNLIPRLEIKVK